MDRQRVRNIVLAMIAAALLGVGVDSKANAATFAIFTDRPSFEAAVDGTAVEDFTDATLVPGLTIMSDSGFISGGRFQDFLGNSNNPTQTAFLTAQALIGIGGEFDLGAAGSGPGSGIQITAFFVGGGSQALPIEIPNSFTGNFFGFTSDMAFDKVVLSSGSQLGPTGVESYDLDNLTLAPSAVPLPGTLPLLGGALAALALFQRKKN